MPPTQNLSTDSSAHHIALNAIRDLPLGGVALLIGTSDRGKTTFVAWAARELARSGERVAVVDSDIGTSEIGPPGTVGVGWAERGQERERLHDLRPAALFFAGALTPRAVPLEWLAATVAAVRWAQAAGARYVLIDTPGDVFGPGPRRLFAALTLAIAPGVVVGIHGSGEKLFVAQVTAALTGVAAAPPSMLIESSPNVRKRSTPQRALLRQTRLSIALEGGRELRVPLATGNAETSGGSVQTIGTTLGAGAVVAPHLTRWIAETLRLPAGALSRAEVTEETLTVLTDSEAAPINEAALARSSGVIARHFGVRHVRALSSGVLAGTYLGLIGDEGRLLAVGRFEGVAAETGALRVFAAGISASDSDAINRIRAVHFGRFRVGRDGAFQGDLRPGEA